MKLRARSLAKLGMTPAEGGSGPVDLGCLTCYKNWFCVEPARGRLHSLNAGFLAQNIRRGQA